MNSPGNKVLPPGASPYHWTILMYNVKDKGWIHYNSLLDRKGVNPHLSDATTVVKHTSFFQVTVFNQIKNLENNINCYLVCKHRKSMLRSSSRGSMLRHLPEPWSLPKVTLMHPYMQPNSHLSKVNTRKPKKYFSLTNPNLQSITRLLLTTFLTSKCRVDCGVIVCQIITNLSSGDPIPTTLTQQEVNTYRVRLAFDFLYDEPRSWSLEKWQRKQATHGGRKWTWWNNIILHFLIIEIELVGSILVVGYFFDKPSW